MKKPTYYITTPIYYPSGHWHLGHTYTTVACDAAARFKRMSGFDVFYLTGTDEHGQKIEKRAAESGTSPKAFVDGLVTEIKQLWEKLGITYDKFIRTTDGYHVKAVQKIFKKLYEQGYIYKSKYKGKYCTPCEAFWTSSQLVDGKCPDCGREVSDAEEESYFFRLSKYADRVRKLLTETDFLQPASRVNEMVGNFIDKGLSDLCVSRTSFKWGIPVDFDEGHIVYVWVDALSNYITALGAFSNDEKLLKKYWPADLHMVGKEIVRFHSIVWPAILMALGLPLPKKVFGHGWLLLDGDKMSKSKGNVVDPFILIDRYGRDALRYYLLREIPFGADGVYSNAAFITRLNADIVNDLGNLLRRTLAMIEKYFDGKIEKGGKKEPLDDDFVSCIDGLYDKVNARMESLEYTRALEEIFAVVGRANKYIDETMPWALAKDETKRSRLQAVLYNLAEALRVSAVLLKPFLTEYPSRIFEGLGVKEPELFDGNAKYGKESEYKIKSIPPLMERLDLKKELDELGAIAAEKEGGEKKEEKKKVEENVRHEDDGIVTIDEFFKTKLKVAKVVACEKVEKTEKLLKLTLDVGGEERTVVSGIAKFYTPEEMIGKSVVLVSNLKPAKLRGIESRGMILCASHGDKLCLVTPEQAMEAGAEVC